MNYPQFQQAFEEAEAALFRALEAAGTLEQRVLISGARDSLNEGYRALPEDQRAVA